MLHAFVPDVNTDIESDPHLLSEESPIYFDDDVMLPLQEGHQVKLS